MVPNRNSRPLWLLPIAVFAILFGVVTIYSGGNSLFTDAGRSAAGSYVPFVLWFNFIAGFAYVMTGSGLAFDRTWSGYLAITIAITTCCIFLMFGIHIVVGKAFEMRTVIAMFFRSTFWVITAGLAYRRYLKK